jgi:putative transposase
MSKLLNLGSVYHLTDHAVHNDNLFIDPDNYRYFLSLYEEKLIWVVDTMAYCLMPNHFHIAIRVKSKAQILAAPPEVLAKWKLSEDSTLLQFQQRISQQFANLFNAYAQAINKQRGRKGALFSGNFDTTEVTSKQYFYNMICYIHYNPVKHGFCTDFRTWEYSSYNILLSGQKTFLRSDLVLNCFKNVENFEEMHEQWKPKM